MLALCCVLRACTGAETRSSRSHSGATEVRSNTVILERPWRHAAQPSCAAQVSGSYDTTVRFWNLDSLRCVRKCEGHEDAVRVLAVVNGKVLYEPKPPWKPSSCRRGSLRCVYVSFLRLEVPQGGCNRVAATG